MDEFGYLDPNKLPNESETSVSNGVSNGYPHLPGYSGTPTRDTPGAESTEPVEVTQIKTLQNYQLKELLGKGFFGEVWKATRDDTIVALKIINVTPDNVENIYREVEVLKRISEPRCQPFLVCYRDSIYLKDQQKFLIEMDLVVGRNIEKFIADTPDYKRNKYLLLILKDIVTALSYLHSHGIIHNDVKPDNILITSELTPVLVDFGVSCFDTSWCALPSLPSSALSRSSDLSDLSSSLSSLSFSSLSVPSLPSADNRKLPCCTGIKGPYIYVSPETIKSEAYYTQSDMWSLGVTCYKTITGSYPFDIPTSGNIQSLFYNIRHQPLRKLITDSRTLNYIVNRCLDRNPLTRIKPNEISLILSSLN